jgi:Outer membrane protein beta-barrel domain
MKNTLRTLLLAGLTLFVIRTDAQMVMGLKGGINYSGFSNHDGGRRVSGHGGIFIHTVLNKKLHLQPELLYSSEGQRYIITVAEENVEKTVSVNSASLPLMFQYFATPKCMIEAGPQLSFITSVIDRIPGSDKLNVKRSFANTQFGINIGLGFMATRQAGLYARYCLGFTDLTRFDSNADFNRVLQAGLLFRFK